MEMFHAWLQFDKMGMSTPRTDLEDFSAIYTMKLEFPEIIEAVGPIGMALDAPLSVKR